jgi:homoserine kinase
MNQTKVCVKVPASTANLGPGFDCLGLALNLYAWIEMDFAIKTKVSLYGKQMLGIPLDKSNLIYQVAQMVFAEAGVSHPEIEIAMYSEIPLTRGLGSSASTIIGGMVAANALISNALSNDKIFQMATQLEKHPDNVGASLFGGFIVASWDGVRAECIRIAPHERLEVLVAIPEFQLSTEIARHALPKDVLLKDAVFNLSHSSMLVAALCCGQLEMIRHAMQDVLHQPYRAAFIPGMTTILREATEHGALGVALSGAGPTLLALVDKKSHEKATLAKFMQDTFLKEDIRAKMMWLQPDAIGVQILEKPVNLSDLAAAHT